MPSIDFEVRCNECGSDLDAEINQTTRYRNGRTEYFTELLVYLCDRCIQKEHDAGFEEGKGE